MCFTFEKEAEGLAGVEGEGSVTESPFHTEPTYDDEPSHDDMHAYNATFRSAEFSNSEERDLLVHNPGCRFLTRVFHN